MLHERERCIDFCVTQRYMLVTDGRNGPPLAALFPNPAPYCGNSPIPLS